MEAVFYTVQYSIQAATLYTIKKVTKTSPTENCFCQVIWPTVHPLDSHNTQQERLNSKLVLLSPCCALLLWVLQSSHGSQVRKQQCQCLSLLVSCASTLTTITTPNNIPLSVSTNPEKNQVLNSVSSHLS